MSTLGVVADVVVCGIGVGLEAAPGQARSELVVGGLDQ